MPLKVGDEQPLAGSGALNGRAHDLPERLQRALKSAGAAFRPASRSERLRWRSRTFSSSGLRRLWTWHAERGEAPLEAPW